MAKHAFDFDTEYYQFYLLAAHTKAITDAPDFGWPEADARRLAIGQGLFGITITTYGGMAVCNCSHNNHLHSLMEALRHRAY